MPEKQKIKIQEGTSKKKIQEAGEAALSELVKMINPPLGMGIHNLQYKIGR
jgi:hypothetical protein